jgi:hypothetical protein
MIIKESVIRAAIHSGYPLLIEINEVEMLVFPRALEVSQDARLLKADHLEDGLSMPRIIDLDKVDYLLPCPPASSLQVTAAA